MSYDLNEEQLNAMQHEGGPLLIVAGAGTGKTTVITERISYLVKKKNASPSQILAVTFTEKASAEMEERIDKALPYGYVDLWVHTFHSFCQRILEDYGIEIGLPTNFRVLDPTQAWVLVHKNIDRFELDYYRPLGTPTKFIHALLSHFSRLKDEAIWPSDYLSYSENIELNSDSAHFISQILSADELESLSKIEIKQLAVQEQKKIHEIAHAYHTYQELLHENSALDFGDLINYTLKLFSERPKVLAKFRTQFQYILVDEFQDTNWAQYELIKKLSAPKNNLTVCGDDDQSIYKFRGASISNILQFKKDFPKAHEVFLVKNYRSYQNILDAAYRSIQNNNPNRLEVMLTSEKKFSKKLISVKSGEGILSHLEFETQEDEMRGVIASILALKEKSPDVQWSDFAILVRANSHADIFNYGLEQSGIPYSFVASKGLYSKTIILDILSWLRLLDDYHESTALFHILSIPVFQFSQKEIVNFNYWAKRKGRSLYSTLLVSPTLENISQETLKKINRIMGMIERHTHDADKKSVKEIILQFLEDSGILAEISKKENRENQLAISYLNQFFKKISDFETNSHEKGVKNFLQLMNLELQAGEKGRLETDFEEGPDTVKVMTVHASKGLEFDYVFVVHLVDRRFPTQERREQIQIPDELVKEILPLGDIHLQEERRLFYVACTRTKKGLFLTSALDYGGQRRKKQSIFLSEIHAKKTAGSEIKSDFTAIAKLQHTEKEYYRMPERFSFSQLKAYENCPWQYRYAFILRVPVKGKAIFSFGKTLHLVMQKVFSLVSSKQEKKQQDLFSTGNKSQYALSEIIELKEIQDIYKAYFIDDWYENEKQKNNFFEKGKHILKIFYEENKSKILNPKYLEKSFSIKIIDPKNGRQYSLHGVIDRVDETPDGFEIVDYKTGKPKKDLTADDKEQLLIYQLAGKNIFEQAVQKLTFYYLDEGGQEISFIGSEDELLKLEQKIIRVIHKIEEGKFKPTPGYVCLNCDFKEICPFKYTG